MLLIERTHQCRILIIALHIIDKIIQTSIIYYYAILLF